MNIELAADTLFQYLLDVGMKGFGIGIRRNVSEIIIYSEKDIKSDLLPTIWQDYTVRLEVIGRIKW
jgi:hypothetical protein